MEKFDDIILGFGKGGKTLAGKLAGDGERVALVERSAGMYGGTCINVACIPTKSLENSARQSAAQGGSFEEKAARYTAAIAEKRRLTGMLRQKNYDKVVSAGVQVLTGTAKLLDAHRVLVSFADGTTQELEGERIFLNTGSLPFLPPIAGLAESSRVYTSETLMELDALPRELVVIGGGYIGLEFSSYFTNFGSKVTVLQDGAAFIPREDAEVAESVLDSFGKRGITVRRSVAVQRIGERDGRALVEFTSEAGAESLTADAVLVATGRRPNVQGLGLEAAGVELTERGAVKVDAQLRTTAPNIFAMGDVVGGLQFTYISLDDFRIVYSTLRGGSRTTANRGAVPYTVFLDPPLSRVGMTEDEARKAGFEVQVAKLPAAAVPKAQVLRQPTGLLKAVLDAKTGQLLGAHLFCAESQEMINLLKLAIDAKLPYSVLRDAIYNHPTMSEAFNDLFAAVK